MDGLLQDYERWLESRSAMLVRFFGCERDDAYQELVLGLLQYESQKTSWLRAFSLFRREERSRGLTYVPEDIRARIHSLGDMAHVVDRSASDHVDLSDWLRTNLFADELELVAAYLEGHTQDEIAEALGVSRRTVCRMLAEIRLVLAGDLHS